MNLTEGQIRDYRRDGFLLLESVFDADEVDMLSSAYGHDCALPGDHRITEAGGDQIRAIYASHQRRPEFAALVRSARLLAPVWQLLTDQVYVYQFKINAKLPFGESWAWHQDYVAWKLADNLPKPSLVNVAVFLDDVTEFNGPVIFVPGSHCYGLVREDRGADEASEQHLDPDDIALSAAQLAALVDRHGMASPKAPAGSIVFFDPQVVHASAHNLSPFPRRVLLVTYNDVANRPRPVGTPRPEYLVGRDTAPLRIDDGALLDSTEAIRVPVGKR